HVEPRAARQRARDQKCKGSRVFRPCAKASLQKLVNRYDPKVIIGLDENQGDYDTPQQCTQSKLCVSKVARGISLFGSTEERAGAGLRRKDRRQHCPPRDAQTTVDLRIRWCGQLSVIRKMRHAKMHRAC